MLIFILKYVGLQFDESAPDKSYKDAAIQCNLAGLPALRLYNSDSQSDGADDSDKLTSDDDHSVDDEDYIQGEAAGVDGGKQMKSREIEG